MHGMNKLTDNRKKKEKRPGLAWATPRWLLTVLRATEKDNCLTVFPPAWAWRLESAEPKELFRLPTAQSGPNGFHTLFVFLPFILPQEQGMVCGVWPDRVSTVCTPLKGLLLLCLTVEWPINAFLSVDITQKLFVNPLFSMRFWKSWGDRPRKITESSFARKRVVNIILPNGSLTYYSHWQNEQNQK